MMKHLYFGSAFLVVGMILSGCSAPPPSNEVAQVGGNEVIANVPTVKPSSPVIPVEERDEGDQMIISLDGLAKRMDDLGWSMFVAQNPKCVSVCLGDQHTTLWKEWVQDLGMCTAAMLQHSGAGSTASPASPAPSADIKGPYSAAGSVKSSAERKVLSDRLKDYVESMFTVTPQPPAGKL